MTDDQSSIFGVFRQSALANRDRPALEWADGDSVTGVTYGELLEWVEDVAMGFMSLGIGKGDAIALFADNRPEWIVADLALLALGATDVPRGTDTAPEELGYIVGHSGCRGAVVADPRFAMGMKPSLYREQIK